MFPNCVPSAEKRHVTPRQTVHKVQGAPPPNQRRTLRPIPSSGSNSDTDTDTPLFPPGPNVGMRVSPATSIPKDTGKRTRRDRQLPPYPQSMEILRLREFPGNRVRQVTFRRTTPRYKPDQRPGLKRFESLDDENS